MGESGAFIMRGQYCGVAKIVEFSLQYRYHVLYGGLLT